MALITPYWILDVVLIFFQALVAAYIYMTRNFNYWKKKGVQEIPPTPFVGNFGACCLLRTSIAEHFQTFYERGKGTPYLGFYIFDTPSLLLRDPEIIKSILIKDFDDFQNRYGAASDSDVMGRENLFFLKKPTWRDLRQKLTPVFSPGKMKAMFRLVADVGNDLTTHLEDLKLDGDGRVLELKEISAKFTTDNIGSCIFGLQVNSLNNPDAEFRKFGRKVFDFTYRRGLELMSIFFIPRIVKPLGFKVFEPASTEFLRKALSETLIKRRESGLQRDDLIDILIQLQDSQTNTDDIKTFKFDGDTLVAQAAIFFTAGFETSSMLMSFTLHELSLQPDLQAKLRSEINSALEESRGILTYDMVQQLEFLDKVAWETLRKYPSVTFLDREASRDYTIKTTGLVIEKGTPVYVPLFGLHNDPEYFPDPEKYDPERFSKENKRQLPACVYMPFGEGPRNCIGLRFGLMQAKVGIIKVLSNYELTPCEQTSHPVRFDPKAAVLSPVDGLYHRVRKIKNTID